MNLEQKEQQELESMVLETRKVKALEKIANSLDALTVWFEEIDKKEWGERLAYYLYEYHNILKDGVSPSSVLDSSNSSDNTPTPPRKVRPKKDIEKV